jgi:hypothetical protein
MAKRMWNMRETAICVRAARRSSMRGRIKDAKDTVVLGVLWGSSAYGA